MVKRPIFMILTLWPNDDTTWKCDLNDDHDDHGTLSTMNYLNMVISINHGAETSSDNLASLTNDKPFI